MFSSLSIIIPAFNEGSRINQTVADVLNKVSKVASDCDLIIVDDGSTDKTIEKIKNDFSDQFSSGVLKVFSIKHTGKGAAVKAGVLEAKKEWILFMDADNSASIDQLYHFFSYSDFDVIVGSREVESHWTKRVEQKSRKLTGRLFNWTVRKLLKLPWLDTQCGFKLFKKQTAKQLFGLLKEDGFVFDVEILYLADKIGARVREVGIDWYKSEQTSVRLCRDGLKMFLSLFRIKKRWAQYVF